MGSADRLSSGPKPTVRGSRPRWGVYVRASNHKKTIPISPPKIRHLAGAVVPWWYLRSMNHQILAFEGLKKPGTSAHVFIRLHLPNIVNLAGARQDNVRRTARLLEWWPTIAPG